MVASAVEERPTETEQPVEAKDFSHYYPAKSIGLNRDLSVPDFSELSEKVRIDALEVFSKAVSNTTDAVYDETRMLGAAEFFNEFEEEIQAVAESPARIRYDGMVQLDQELYYLNYLRLPPSEQSKVEHPKGHRQQRKRLRRKVGEKLEMDLGIHDEYWPIKAAMVYLGSVGCSVAGKRSSTRPYLPMVGAGLIVKYESILIAYPGEERTDKEISESAYIPVSKGGLGYFDPH